MKRKILVTVILLVMLATSLSVLFACEKPSSDNFSGVLSAESHATANEAAQAYLEQEFAGETENLVFESYEKKQDLSRSEIKNLPLGEYKESDVEKAEKGEIKYTESVSRAADEGEIEVQVKFVVLVFINGKYHYCILGALPGEKISKSYYTSVLDLSQYESYVFESIASFSGQTIPRGDEELNFTIRQKMIYTKDAIYVEVQTSGLGEEMGMKDIDAASYVLPNDENSCIVFTKDKTNGNDQDWTQNTIVGVLTDYSANLLMAMDQSYFVKTEDGFKVDEKKYGKYLEKVYGQIFEMLTSGMEVTTNSAKAVYHVKDGHLSTSEGAFNLTVKSGDQNIRIVTANNIKVSDINTATLTVPQELLNSVK